MPIIGTAGHVDHGKSALVEALTGTNPDRWLEERLRGMTLDLGFARLVLDDGLEAGIIDVPGHERFLHNMLAGAAGMELLLLVVAADEGVMPQTREHLDVLRFLNVAQTIVVVTKIDLVPQDQRAAAVERIAAALRGTIADGAPIVAVSSRTGESLPQLRDSIAAALHSLPPRDDAAPVYFPIDRVFTLPGHGTIVTGTLVQGTIATGEALALEPSGIAARVRSVHVFGEARERAGAGTRVALNLPGVDRSAIARGEAAVSSEFSARTDFAVTFTPLEAALPLLRRRMPVRAYLGAAEILGTLVFESVPREARATAANLHLRSGAVAFPGVRFVVRRASPKTLLGGGSVESLAVAPPSLRATPAEAAVAAALRGGGLTALDAAAVAYAANVRETVARAALERLAQRDDAFAIRRPEAYIDGTAARELLARTLAHLESVQLARPWALGVTSLALARELGVDEALLMRVLAAFVESGWLAGRGGYYATLDHHPALSPEQRALFDELVPSAPASFVPVPFTGVAAAIKRSRIEGAVVALDTMLALGAFVRVGDDCYRGSQIVAVRARVETHLRARQRMTAAEFRDLLGTSRKYAVPLLEWLDANGVTVRDGDYRTLRKHAPQSKNASGG